MTSAGQKKRTALSHYPKSCKNSDSKIFLQETELSLFNGLNESVKRQSISKKMCLNLHLP